MIPWQSPPNPPPCPGAGGNRCGQWARVISETAQLFTGWTTDTPSSPKLTTRVGKPRPTSATTPGTPGAGTTPTVSVAQTCANDLMNQNYLAASERCGPQQRYNVRFTLVVIERGIQKRLETALSGLYLDDVRHVWDEVLSHPGSTMDDIQPVV